MWSQILIYLFSIEYHVFGAVTFTSLSTLLYDMDINLPQLNFFDFWFHKKGSE